MSLGQCHLVRSRHVKSSTKLRVPQSHVILPAGGPPVPCGRGAQHFFSTNLLVIFFFFCKSFNNNSKLISLNGMHIRIYVLHSNNAKFDFKTFGESLKKIMKGDSLLYSRHILERGQCKLKLVLCFGRSYLKQIGFNRMR